MYKKLFTSIIRKKLKSLMTFLLKKINLLSFVNILFLSLTLRKTLCSNKAKNSNNKFNLEN